MFSKTCKSVLLKEKFNTNFNNEINNKPHSKHIKTKLTRSTTQLTDCETIITELAQEGYSLIEEMQTIVDKLKESTAQEKTIVECKSTLDRKIQRANAAVTKAKESSMTPLTEDAVAACLLLNEQVDAFKDFLDEFLSNLSKQEKLDADATLCITERLFVLPNRDDDSNIFETSPNDNDDKSVTLQGSDLNNNDDSVQLRRSNFCS